MSELHEKICSHWDTRGDLDFILAQLERRGVSKDDLEIEDLTTYDHLHAGQLEATIEFLNWIGELRGVKSVLDVGSGLGGTARYLAREIECHVTALELSPVLNESGKKLSQWLGIDDLVMHFCGDIIDFEPTRTYDLVILQHVDMHIPNKIEVYEACRNVLPVGIGGRVVWHDWLAGSGGPLYLPVPWSREDEDITFLSDFEEFRSNLVAAGLAMVRFQPLPGETALWFNKSRDRIQKILEKDIVEDREYLKNILAEIEGVLRNIAERRLMPFFAEVRRVE